MATKKPETYEGPPTETPEPTKSKGKIVKDPELLAMSRINRIIDSLPNDRVRLRVVSWLRDKLETPLFEEQKTA